MVLGTLCCCTGEPVTWDCPGHTHFRADELNCSDIGSNWFDVMRVAGTTVGSNPSGAVGLHDILNGLHMLYLPGPLQYNFSDGGILQLSCAPFPVPPNNSRATMSYDPAAEAYWWRKDGPLPIDCGAEFNFVPAEFEDQSATPFPFWEIEPRAATIDWNPIGVIPQNLMPAMVDGNWLIALGQPEWVTYDGNGHVRLRWFGQLYRWFTNVILNDAGWYQFHFAYCDDNTALKDDTWRLYYDAGAGRQYPYIGFGANTPVPPLDLPAGNYEIGIEMQAGVINTTALTLFDFFLQKLG